MFADGAAAILVCGDEVSVPTTKIVPHIVATASKWMPDSEDVMGWDVKNNGLHVVFSKNIPTIITEWLGPFIEEFLGEQQLQKEQIVNFVAHPGGKKVLQAYEKTLELSTHQTTLSRDILRANGNMSSPTVLYVLEKSMLQDNRVGDYGLLVALGPGFCGESVLLEWRE